jgi:hypothetical protein
MSKILSEEERKRTIHISEVPEEGIFSCYNSRSEKNFFKLIGYDTNMTDRYWNRRIVYVIENIRGLVFSIEDLGYVQKETMTSAQWEAEQALYALKRKSR